MSLLADWNVGLAKHIGIRFVEATKDRVVAEIDVKPEVMTTTGTIHGGTLMAFADTVGAAGTVVNLVPGQSTATLESKTMCGTRPSGHWASKRLRRSCQARRGLT